MKAGRDTQGHISRWLNLACVLWFVLHCGWLIAASIEVVPSGTGGAASTVEVRGQSGIRINGTENTTVTSPYFLIDFGPIITVGTVDALLANVTTVNVTRLNAEGSTGTVSSTNYDGLLANLTTVNVTRLNAEGATGKVSTTLVDASVGHITTLNTTNTNSTNLSATNGFFDAIFLPRTSAAGPTAKVSATLFDGLQANLTTANVTQLNATGPAGNVSATNIQARIGNITTLNTTTTSGSFAIFTTVNATTSQANFGNFTTLNTTTARGNFAIFTTINATTSQANFGNFTTLNTTTARGNFGIFTTLNATTSQANFGNFTTLNATTTQSTFGIFPTLNATTSQANFGNFVTLNVTTMNALGPAGNVSATNTQALVGNITTLNVTNINATNGFHSSGINNLTTLNVTTLNAIGPAGNVSATNIQALVGNITTINVTSLVAPGSSGNVSTTGLRVEIGTVNTSISTPLVHHTGVAGDTSNVTAGVQWFDTTAGMSSFRLPIFPSVLPTNGQGADFFPNLFFETTNSGTGNTATAETEFDQFVEPAAGTMNVANRYIVIDWFGSYASDASPGNLALSFRVNSTTVIAAPAANLLIGATTSAWYCRTHIVTNATGSSGTFFAYHTQQVDDGNAAMANSIKAALPTVAFDLTASAATKVRFKLTSTMSSAGNTVTLRRVFARVIR